MNITIDSGNTLTKIAFFENGKLLKSFATGDIEKIMEMIPDDENNQVIISSVNQSIALLKEKIQGYRRIIILDHTTPVPIVNKYKTPETLGMDRLAAVVGAKGYFENDPCLVIDAGSCITYDLIDQTNNYLGGSISPGVSIRFKSLHSFTAKLPLIDPLEYRNKHLIGLIGTNTREAILSGVIQGIASELNGIIAEYQKLYPGIKILICGGDANYFESKINQPIFAIPELVHWGLNRILQHNESEL